jgi:16S rRNA (cytosine1402-N4)-methyltransferase
MTKEVLSLLVTNTKGLYLDATGGGGGHSYALLNAFAHISLITSDWDLDAIKACEKRLEPFSNRVTLIQSSFSKLSYTLKKRYDVEALDGILGDFGTSQNQLLHRDGFSFFQDSPLDMRMSTSHRKVLAMDIVRDASFCELRDIFFYYGGEEEAQKIAKAIIAERKVRPIRTSLHLASLVAKHKRQFKKIHPATKVFQALRIAVNKEIKEIEIFFQTLPQLLVSGGRLCCISFHSLEDRLVKKFASSHKESFKKVTEEKYLRPLEEEIQENPASRSSLMRVFEKNKIQ